MKLLRASIFSVVSCVVAIAANACGSDAPTESGPGNGDDSNSPGTFGGQDGGGDPDAKPCTNLCLRQKECGGGKTTTLSGVVKDPAGKVPLYNALVYVPNAAVAPIKTGASCERCGDVSGSPLVTALTDAAGRFKLENVPVGADIPLVVQIGKWRRQLVVPNVPECVETTLADESIRMPRNKQEGDLPQMAIASGSADPFECLLTKMGIDEAEFTSDTGDGRVHFYRSNGVDTSPSAPAAASLWNDLNKMMKYDLLFLPCEGSDINKPDQQDQNLVAYTSAGGRAFTTHYGYAWLHRGAAPFPTTGSWTPEAAGTEGFIRGDINETFPKGAAFAEWLVNVNASTTRGQLQIRESRSDLESANDPPSTTWMTTSALVNNKTVPLHITFNTPIGTPEAQQCGRVVFSDFHVSADARINNRSFPSSCKPGDLSAQEKALEFMLFDLSSCIQSDKEAPVPPPGVK